jgi:hypothetical protein
VYGIEEEAHENNGVVEFKNWFYNFTYTVLLPLQLISNFVQVIGSLALGDDLNGVRSKEPHEFVAFAVKFFKATDKVHTTS